MGRSSEFNLKGRFEKVKDAVDELDTWVRP